ncbi:P-loop NTPase fold protein [Pseudomonas atacamensis]|uniref:P-loop NTPase fold protein n=1 Tax=Pseudomonas atacamensis TaxID=2565368 RepID=UPI00300E9B76
MEHIERTLDTFLSSQASVIVIKGGWGVGKTFFWESYLSKRKRTNPITQTAYCYVSLFGKGSVEQVRSGILASAVRLVSDEEVERRLESALEKNDSVYGGLIKKYSASAETKARNLMPTINRWFGHVKEAPLINRISGLVDKTGYGFVEDYLICFDDIERKGKGLSIREFMGLVDELAKRKKCKIVLIFNEQSFDEEADLKQFDSYREKIVDMELLYDPSPLANFNLVFRESDFGFLAAKKVVESFNIVNVRVVKKIKQVLDAYLDFFNAYDQKVSYEFCLHAAVLAWAHYSVGSHPSCYEIKKYMSGGSWINLLTLSSESNSEELKAFALSAGELELTGSIFDGPIINYLDCGYCDDDVIKDCITKLQHTVVRRRMSAEWDNAWNLYRNSFENDYENIAGVLRSALDEGIPESNYGDFLTAIDFLTEFGEDVDHWVDAFIEKNQEQIQAGSFGNSYDVKNLRLKSGLREIVGVQYVQTIDETVQRISNGGNWDAEDLEFLTKQTSEDFYQWMKNNPKNLNQKIRKGLFLFRNYKAVTDAQRLVVNRFLDAVVSALNKISLESPLNAKRIKDLYSI